MMIQQGRVQAVSGEYVNVSAETVCLHGDGEHALVFARELKDAFRQQDITVSAE